MAMTQQEAIKKFMASLDKTTKSGEKALDEAIKAMGISKVSTAKEAIEKMLEDRANAKSGDDFLKTYCGINLDNNDTGAITGKDAGGSTTEKTAQSIVPENTKVKLDTNFKATSFTVEKYGVTFHLDNSFNSLSADAQYAWQAMKTWWAEAALDLNKESFGYSYDDGKDKSIEKNILITFSYSGDPMATYRSTVNVDGVAMRKIEINMNQWANLKHDFDGTNSRSDGNTAYMDRDLAHELTHALMYGKIKEFVKIPSLIREGVAEITHGRDDYKTTDLKNFAKSQTIMSQAFDSSSFYATIASGVKADGINSPAYVAGYIFMRYLAKQAAINSATTPLNLENYTNKTVISGTALNDTVRNYAASVTITGGAGTDSLYNSADNAKIDGGNDSDRIVNKGGNNVSIFGGAGNDSLYNDKGTKVTIEGGAGADYISNWDSYAKIYGGDGDDLIYHNEGTNATIDAGAGNDSVKNWDNQVSIFSGAGNDSIYNWGGINSTINGGTGNDYISLSSSSKNNLLVYNSGDGKDTVYGISKNDTLQISGAPYSSEKSGKDLSITVDSGTILIKDAVNTSFTIIGSVKSNPTPNIISLTSGKDNYTNTLSGKTIYALAGNDNIENRASSVTIYGGAGKDSVLNRQSNVVIYGEADADSVINASTNVTVYGGDSNDTLENHSASKGATIHGDAGNDLIKNNGTNAILYGDAGNDKISLGSYSQKSTIIGGAGNDAITLSGGNNFVQYASGDGKDTITGITANDTIKISGAKYSTLKSGKDLSINVGNGSILIKNAANIAVKIDGTLEGGNNGITVKSSVVTASGIFNGSKIDLADYPTATKVNAAAVSQAISIVGSAKANSLKGGKGADTISGGAGNDTVYGGNGSDWLYGDDGNDKISGDAGNDLLIGGNGDDSLNGGAGNDLLVGGIGKNTLTGGAGKDTFYISSGQNYITDYKAGEDTINILSASITSHSFNNKDLILNISTGSSVTIKGGKGKKISFLDSNNKTTSKTYSKTLDLFEDNNYITDSAQLSDITEKKFAVTQVQTPNYSALEQINQTFLTYGKEK